MATTKLKEDQAVLRRLPNRSLLRIFTMGLSAPAFLVQPGMGFQLVRADELSDHAWSNVGSHLYRSLRRVRNDRGPA